MNCLLSVVEDSSPFLCLYFYSTSFYLIQLINCFQRLFYRDENIVCLIYISQLQSKQKKFLMNNNSKNKQLSKISFKVWGKVGVTLQHCQHRSTILPSLCLLLSLFSSFLHILQLKTVLFGVIQEISGKFALFCRNFLFKIKKINHLLNISEHIRWKVLAIAFFNFKQVPYHTKGDNHCKSNL